MKYIRTKDKIEKVPNDYANKLVECPDLRIGNTIEKLCDVYVCNNLLFFSKNQLKDYCYIPNEIIYGAIWTDKGLIYVAKMNDKGELELLWKRYY